MEGILTNRENIKKIRYADDTTLIADVECKLQNIVDKIVAESERFGLSFKDQSNGRGHSIDKIC